MIKKVLAFFLALSLASGALVFAASAAGVSGLDVPANSSLLVSSDVYPSDKDVGADGKDIWDRSGHPEYAFDGDVDTMFSTAYVGNFTAAHYGKEIILTEIRIKPDSDNLGALSHIGIVGYKNRGNFGEVGKDQAILWSGVGEFADDDWYVIDKTSIDKSGWNIGWDGFYIYNSAEGLLSIAEIEFCGYEKGTVSEETPESSVPPVSTEAPLVTTEDPATTSDKTADTTEVPASSGTKAPDPDEKDSGNTVIWIIVAVAVVAGIVAAVIVVSKKNKK